MIIEGMTGAQIREEFIYGLECLRNKIKGMANKIRRHLIEGKLKIHKFVYIDPRKNTWRMVSVQKTKTAIISLPILEYTDLKGGMRIVTSAADEIHIYTGHFISRFKERARFAMENGNEYDDIFLFLALNNLNKAVCFDDNVVQVEYPHGIGVGYSYGDKVFMIRTFLTHDLLSGRQSEISEQMRKALQEESPDDYAFLTSRKYGSAARKS